ncbi:MAG TPA: beta-galactosidase, partial [Armatimonadota bacterium]|nr:beta-galactosidase [Armatimonadota bacterium]
DGNTITGWTWDQRNTNATCVRDTQYAHSGKYALKVTNGTAFAAHVYGMLSSKKAFSLQPGKPYTLSAWIYVAGPNALGGAWLGGGVTWQFRMGFNVAPGNWQQLRMTFVPADKDVPFFLRMITESPTEGFWLDDVQLEEGNTVTPNTQILPQDTLALVPLASETSIVGDGAFSVPYLISVPNDVTGTLHAHMAGMQQVLTKQVTIKKGRWLITVDGKGEMVDNSPHTMALDLTVDTKTVANTTAAVRVYSESWAEKRFAALENRLPGWKKAIDALRAQGQDVSYPMVTYTVIENFINYARIDNRYFQPRDWTLRMNADIVAETHVDTKNVHSGDYAVAMMARGQATLACDAIRLQAGTPYTLSAWVCSKKPGTAWIGGGSQKQFKVQIPSTDGKWQQVSTTFTPGTKDANFTVQIVTESATDDIHIDDIALVQGTTTATGKNLITNGGFETIQREILRAMSQLDELEPMATRLSNDLQAAQRGTLHFAVVPRWTGTVRPTIKSSAFLAPTITSQKKTPVTRPVLFTGYGHFGQVRADIEKFPNYGVNIIQIEVGPSKFFPSEGKYDDAGLHDVQSVLDRCEKAGVALNLLISPHYFPQWALEKYPELAKQRHGFMQFCLHAPQGQALLKEYIGKLIAPIKDHPALHSVVLTNEPVNEEEPCTYALADWHTWLQQRHSTIQTLNARWGTNYASFDAVPLYNAFDSSAKWQGAPWLDFVRFNQESFAAFHQMLANAVHAIAPNIPVHAKAMAWTMLYDNNINYGVDAYLFGKFSQINGNDSTSNYRKFGEFTESWQMDAMDYDLQRSVLDAPVFNSENHIIPDRDTSFVPGSHLYTTLWQNAIHGQSATTIWVWERTFSATSDFSG